MTEIIVEEGTERIIETGNHRLTLLDIRRNATLIFTGPTVILCDRMSSSEGARIIYRTDAILGTDNHFDLFTLDASGVTHLHLIGDGKNGLDYNGKGRASDGHAGRSATNPKPPWDADGREASRGGAGARGTPGGRGEPAVDFMLNFSLVPPGARIHISAVGGNGGAGQNGGTGGPGGNGAALHGAKDGGPGGPGGPGGDSGDAGKIVVFVVVPDEVYESQATRNEVLKTISFTLNSAAGVPGDGGSGGIGGPRGRGGPILDGNPERGVSGEDGNIGQSGVGPRGGEGINWTRIDLIAQSAYRQYYAQLIGAADRGGGN